MAAGAPTEGSLFVNLFTGIGTPCTSVDGGRWLGTTCERWCWSTGDLWYWVASETVDNRAVRNSQVCHCQSLLSCGNMPSWGRFIIFPDNNMYTSPWCWGNGTICLCTISRIYNVWGGFLFFQFDDFCLSFWRSCGLQILIWGLTTPFLRFHCSDVFGWQLFLFSFFSIFLGYSIDMKGTCTVNVKGSGMTTQQLIFHWMTDGTKSMRNSIIMY